MADTDLVPDSGATTPDPRFTTRAELEAEPWEYDDDASDCANCGGEGFTYGCEWDWQCDTWDGDSCLCTRRCEWCNPPKLTAEEQASRGALRAVMAAALAPPPDSDGGGV